MGIGIGIGGENPNPNQQEHPGERLLETLLVLLDRGFERGAAVRFLPALGQREAPG